VHNFVRPHKEKMQEMKASIRTEYGVDAVMNQKRFFYQAYVDSA
jgi:hypothetical protein